MVKFLKRQSASLPAIVFLFFFFFCTNTFALNPFDYSPFSIFVSVEDEIRSGNIITGLVYQAFQIFVTGFDPEEIEYFATVFNVFSPKRYLIMQEFKVPPSKENIKIF